MKKIVSAFLMCCMLLGLQGCGASKEVHKPEDVKRILEDSNYEINKSKIKDDFFVSIEDSSNEMRIFGFYYNEEVSFISYNNKSVNSGSYQLGVLEETDMTSLSKLEKEYSKELQNDFDKWKDNLKISEEELIDFYNWYYKNN